MSSTSTIEPSRTSTKDEETIPPVATKNSATGLVSADHSELHRFVGAYRVHEAADVIPTLEGDAFESLLQDITENGQREPVVVVGDVVITDVDTVRAIGVLKERGVDIDLQTIEWQPRPGQTVPEFLAYKLLQGPRFTDAQRAQIAVDLQPFIEKERAAAQEAARIKPGEVRNPRGTNNRTEGDDGGREDKPTISPAEAKARNKAKRERSTVGQLAKLANVTEHAVRKAQKIKQTASPADLAAVKAGIKKPKDVIAETPPPEVSKPAAKSSKPIDHPFKPSTPLQHDLLTGWLRLRDNKVAVNERVEARDVMRQIMDAEDEADRAVSTHPRKRSALVKGAAK
jgi:hypothetical protein